MIAILSRLFRKIACIDPRPLEIVLAIQALLFGIFFLLPGSAFSTQVYHVLSLIMPEETWGIIFIVSGILEIIVISGRMNRLRIPTATLALFLWLIVDLSSWMSNVNSAAVVSYFTFAIIAMWSAIATSAKEYFGCEH